MKVPQFRSFVDSADYERIAPVFANNYIAEGPQCGEFLDRLLGLIGGRYGVLASNGTMALYLSMRALGVGAGDEVIVQNVSFIASANAVEMTGARPVFVDINGYNDLTIDLSKVEVKRNTKAIVLAHLFGTVCSNIEEVRDFCIEHGLWLIEDAAQALSIRNSESHCGLFGDVGTFSFYADKTITTAEGGMVVTRHRDLHEKMIYLRNQGRKSSGTFIHPEIGYNFRMTDLQGALGLSQLDKLEHIVRTKENIALKYESMLTGRVAFLHRRPDFNYIPFRVIAFVPDASKVIAEMNEHGIEPRSMFYPFHKQPCYSQMSLQDKDFPNSNQCFEQGICLPTWVGMTDEMIEYTAEKLLASL